MKLRFLLLMAIGIGVQQIARCQADKALIFQSDAYNVFGNRVEQGKFKATANSTTELSSNYQSPENEKYSPLIQFKFSINCRDNEMAFGQNHITIIDTPNGFFKNKMIKFGEPTADTTGRKALGNLPPNTKWEVSLDMRPVLKAFKEKGYYTLFNGEKLYQADFKGVYIAGASRPLMWDFNNLKNVAELQLLDKDNSGIYKTTIVLNAQKDERKIDAKWSLSKNTSAFPQYHSDYPLSDAVYNLALEEMIKAVEPDSTFRTGKEWAGVWTRDISYSIILSMAHLQPKVAKYSLMRKVKNKRIIQDTGTGGAYPASTDRMIWAVAAWEVYKATGDMDWLKQSFEIVRNSVEDDMRNAYDAETGLVRGESSFLDWREQTYPKWMQPIDIYQSENLGTNAVHFQANTVLAEMAQLLKETAAESTYRSNAEKIKKGINQYLWMADKGYYGQYLYGKTNMILSPRSEALGEALCVIFNIADTQQKQSVVSHTPITDYGISCIYPQIPGIPPYHNNAVWPFVESYWAQASAKAGNEKSVLECLASVYRPAALFLTNKENYVADNGDYAGTQINSSNMLWSLSGSLSLIQKVIFGIEFKADSLAFHPFVPKSLLGKRSLSNFKYRNTTLDISMEGYGNEIASFELDGKTIKRPALAYSLVGMHSVKIILKNKDLESSNTNKVANYTTLIDPSLKFENGTLSWNAIVGAQNYKVLRNGKMYQQTTETQLKIKEQQYAEYQVIALDAKQIESFASEPLILNGFDKATVIEAETLAAKSTLNYKDFKGDGFIEMTQSTNKQLAFTTKIDTAGTYSISFRYANGNGPINTENKCGIRSVYIDGKYAGAAIFPQRGKDEWSNWGVSNQIKVNLPKGSTKIEIRFEESNNNMNGDINQLMLDQVLIVLLQKS